MPAYTVKTVTKLGQGLDNIAYIVNDELIVRFSKNPDPQQRALRVHREATVLATIAYISPIPVPIPSFTASPKIACLHQAPRRAALQSAAARATGAHRPRLLPRSARF